MLENDHSKYQVTKKKHNNWLPMYQIWLLSSKKTDKNFLVQTLRQYFRLNVKQADQVVVALNRNGKALCGSYTKDVAETKTEEVNSYVMHNQKILKFIIKKDIANAVKKS